MKTRLLLVHNYPAKFVTNDIELLSDPFSVEELYVRSPYRPAPWHVIRAVTDARVVVCWFASWHALLPFCIARLLRKPALVIVGGYDVADEPQIAYGHQRGGVRRLIAKAVIHLASTVVAISRFGASEAQHNAGVSARKLRVVHLCVASSQDAAPLQKEPIVLTVGNLSRSNFERKGLRLFAETSRLVPEARFVAVGRKVDETAETLAKIGGANLQVLDFVPDTELRALYERAGVYVQASAHEGFGLAVAEAMSAGCIPVVTRVGALPEVVGEVGVYVDTATRESLAHGIREALSAPQSRRDGARLRVLNYFSADRRRRRLCAVVQRAIEGGQVR
jgi:glycosyltransferase involved in cell wall biosynthesis